MTERFPMSLLALGLAVAVAGVVAPAETRAQDAADSEEWEVPRTVHGHPDLQGNWTNATLTPLQREEGRGRVYSQAAVDSIEAAAEARFQEGLEPSDPDRGAPPVGGDGSTGAAGGVGGYNRIYIDRGQAIARVHGEPRTSLITRPSNGRIPSLSEEGRARMKQKRQFEARFDRYDHPELRPLGERCIISFGSNMGPPMLPNGFYNNNYTIVQTEDRVLIMVEMVHDTRVIRLGEPEPLPDDVRPWFGDSWGHWEGETLVVETTNIHPDQEFYGVPPSEDRRVVERFTRVDEETILYEFTVHDPEVYSEPWGGQVPMKKFDQQIYEYACHEGNYALYNVLSGARYQEEQEAQEQEEEQARESEGSDDPQR